VTVQRVDIPAAKDIASAFRAAAKARTEAVIWIVGGQVGEGHRKEIVELAGKHRLPVIYHRGSFVEAGGLMAYSTSLND
jgi:putative ABC transport system substrate-binding protein